MEPTNQPAKPDPLLARIDESLGKMLGSQDEFKARLKALEDSNAEAMARLKATDEKVKAVDEYASEIEAKVVKGRFGGGPGFSESDALQNALPDDLKKWIPRVKIQAGTTEVARAVPGLSGILGRMAANDPVLYVAAGGWFQSQVKAALAARNNNPAKAAEWKERGEKIAEAMGGIAVEAKAALQEDTAAEGGYLIPTVTEAMIGWLMKEASVVRAAGATVIQMTTKTHQLPNLANDFSVSWTAEEGTYTDAAPATPFGQVNLTAKKQTGLVTVSIELIQDNIVNLMDFVMAHLIMLVGRSEDTQALEGDGTVFTGLFSASGVNSVAGGSNALSEDELRKLLYAGEHAATLDGGVIFAHPWILRDALGLAISSGTPWFPVIFGQGAQGNGRPANIWGAPAFLTSVIARNRGGGTNETTAYYGRPGYIVIGDRMASTFDVNPWSETEFKKGQILLRLTRRVGIAVWVPAYFNKLTAVTVAA